MLTSIVIRTLNEAQYLNGLLTSIHQQKLSNELRFEVILIDSGSTDETLKIAKHHNCMIGHITRKEFSFGRSLNIGCQMAKGEILVFISGHCVPKDKQWLQALCLPIMNKQADYTYGRQVGGEESQFSEHRIFSKYFPQQSKIPQDGFYCNNANSALSHKSWKAFQFNEELTGLEDMDLARRLVERKGKVAYIAEACVYHHHSESWSSIQRRFEREAIALQKIMPQVHIGRRDLIRYIISSIWLDLRASLRDKTFLKNVKSIILYRFSQYRGSYKGNHEHRILSHKKKEIYFYPD
ncbi:MAG: glycosyltransferase [Cocleimonas sp.]